MRGSPDAHKHTDLNIKHTPWTALETHYSISVHLFLLYALHSQAVTRMEGQLPDAHGVAWQPFLEEELHANLKLQADFCPKRRGFKV